MKTSGTKYYLESRTEKFAKEVILLCQKVEQDSINKNSVSQLVKAATSVGANCEADDAESGKDFKHKIATCKKEAREAKYWLNILKLTEKYIDKELSSLSQEAKELNLIFNAIYRKLGPKNIVDEKAI